MIKYIVFILFFVLSAAAEEEQLLLQIEEKINNSISEKSQLAVEKQELETQIKELQSKIRERKTLLVKRLKALSRLKNFQLGELLVEINLNELNRNLHILNNLNKYDYELFKDYNLSLRFLAVSKKNLVDTEKQIQNNIQVYQEQQAEFFKLENVKISQLKEKKSDSFLLKKGQLTRPLEGLLKQEYGHLSDFCKRYALVSRGESYQTKKPTPVKSIGLGVVIFSDVMNRWRETLVVQHSDNYYSVYAGLKNLNKHVGDKVLENEIIAQTSGSEFYFELRHYANPINPKKWYRSRYE